MQLKKKTRRASCHRQIGAPLAAATCALLGQSAPGEVLAQELTPWNIDTSMLLYSEADGRVQDLSLNALGRKELREDSFLNLTLAIDTLTGASPSGAVPSAAVQTFTRPSGNDQYVVAATEQPLDDTFQDTRTALSASWEWPVTRLALLSVGASLSDEYDYTHAGINARVARDFNNRNTTLSVGLALANDTISPVGGSPTPFSPMLGEGNLSNRRGDQSKDVLDLLFGVTQVLNRKTLVQFNYSLSQSDGYLTDPYKILSVVDPLTGNLTPGPIGSGVNRYLYESRPETRDKQSLFALIKRDFNGDVLDVSYRYMTDDWGIDSHTFDVHYRWNLSEGRYLQPHVRFYSQNAADFYQTVLFAGQALPSYATADYRLGKFDGITFGLKYGKETRSGEFSTRLEWYQQSGEPSPNAMIGSLAGLQLYPDLNALIAQFSYSFGR
ncbi:MAG TPA: DUF3570 domain-containing protein [Gammaproteobacteria bacterium]|nr:DUF3570 domain-containing protein [Gammaproteobacteria bacterium]